MEANLDLGMPQKWQEKIQTTYAQLEPGEYVPDADTIDLHDVLLIHERSNLHVFAAGYFPGHIVFLFPLNVEGPYLVNEALYNDARQIVLMGNQKNCALIPHNFEQLLVAIRIDSLSSYLAQEEIDLLLGIASSRSQFSVDSQHRKKASDFVQEIQQRILQDKEVTEKCESKARSYNRLIISFLTDYMVYNQEQQRPAEGSSNHERIIHRGLHFLSSEHELPVTLDRLSSELFTSKRSVQYAFSEIAGKSPMEFSKIIKLNKIRNELSLAEDNKAAMLDILLKYHITNPGRFKNEYFEFFGEYPRDTMAGKPVKHPLLLGFLPWLESLNVGLLDFEFLLPMVV